MFSDVSFDFRGRTAVVTGVTAPRGIGRALARALARCGATVAGCGLGAPHLAELRRELPDGLWRETDVRSRAGVESFVQQVQERFGRIDILVNNAAIAPFAPVLDVSEERWDAVYDTNVKGYFLVAQAVAREMIAAGVPGCIVNISSVVAHTSGEHKVPYCSTKAAVANLTQGLALELARHGIRVNAVEPGSIDTEIVQEAYLHDFLAELRRDPGLPINRLGVAEEVVGAVLFLCSEAARYITGAAIRVDGGQSAGARLPEAVWQRYAATKREP